MTIIFKGHSFHYEMERLYRSFFLPHKAKVYIDNYNEDEYYSICNAALEDKEYLICERLIKKESIELRVKALICEKLIEKKETLPLSTGEKEQELAFSRLLYNTLNLLTGKSLSWGIMTGIRPTKYIKTLSLSDEEISKNYYVSKEKISLSRRINDLQQPIINSIDINDFCLYISIPFCPTRCSYCSFISQANKNSDNVISVYLEKLKIELDYIRSITQKKGYKLKSIYIGGGTPTILSSTQIDALLKTVMRFDTSSLCEFTCEAGRPDTITLEKLRVLKEYGVGRISINPQSLSDDVLKAIGRLHSTEQIYQAFNYAEKVGFNVINSDLIAGLPKDNLDSFKHSLNEIINLGAENITIHTLALKRSSNMYGNTDFKALTLESSDEIDSMCEYSFNVLNNNSYLPYYLYRQKNSSSDYENIGYCKKNKESFYNIAIMEECCNILGAGANSSTKLINKDKNKGALIKRIYNYKYPVEYINNFNVQLKRKEEIENLLN